jgi:Tfp pilus assembly protein PilF
MERALMLQRVCFCAILIFVCFAVPFRSIYGQSPTTGPSGAASIVPAPPTPLIEPVPVHTSPLKDAQELYRSGKLRAAEDVYKATLQSDPRSAPAYAGLARIYLKENRVPAASEAAAKALELAPQMSAGHVAMGEVYLRQAKTIEAETEFLSQVKRGTSDPFTIV